MKKSVLAFACLAALILDTVFFQSPAVRFFAPRALIALCVSVGVHAGLVPIAAVGAILGAIVDIGFNAHFGTGMLSAICASIAGGVFYGRYYADNVVIPAVVTAVFVFFWEHALLILSALLGGRISGYGLILIKHIIPCALLSGALCAVIHPILKKKLFRADRRRDIDYLRRVR